MTIGDGEISKIQTMDLALRHHTSADRLPAGAGPIWRTCLRQIEFRDGMDGGDQPVVTHSEAYRLLLEVVCGLQSPLPGETQVQGQFKAFLDGLGAEHGWLHRLGQRILTDAKAVREAHLQGLGPHSYGSAVRARVRDCARAAVVGTGALATEVVSSLTPVVAVDQWGRRRLADLDVARPAPATGRTALVIAAPIGEDVVRRLTGCYADLACIIDLREGAPAPVTGPGVTVVTLADVFADAEQARARAASAVQAARADVARRADAWARREELRPFGWEDLCA